jgi:energy-coupling factor transport system permease protein
MKPKLNLLLIFMITTVMLLFTSPVIIATMAASAMLLLFAFRLHRNFILWVKPIFLVVVVIILLQTFASPLFVFSVEGFYFGILYAARFLTMLAFISIFVHTTGVPRLAEAFDFLPKAISQVIVLALALLPSMTELTEKILNAQKCRGLNFRSPNIFRTYFPVLVPLFAKTLERSERMALAMQARGYDG